MANPGGGPDNGQGSTTEIDTVEAKDGGGAIGVNKGKVHIGDNIAGDKVGRDNITNHIYQAAEAYRAGPLHQLPAVPENFTGRSEDIERICAAVRGAQAGDQAQPGGTAGRVVNLTASLDGMPGVGKTALAIMAGYALAEKDFPDIQLFIALRSHSGAPVSAEAARDSVLQLAYPEAKLPDDQDALWGHYQRLFIAKSGAPRKGLVVLDDVANEAQARHFAPPAGSALLITSRQRLALGTAVTVERLPRADAVTLLRAIAPRLEGVATEAQLDSLATRCGDIPVALRAAAGFLKTRVTVSVADYLAGLEKDSLDQLDMGNGQAEDAVGIVFGYSYGKLPEAGQRAWTALSVMPASFDRAAGAAAVAAAYTAKDWLDELVCLHLLEFAPGRDGTGQDAPETGRFDWHDLLRAYATAPARLPSEAAEAARLGHAAHYAEVAQRADTLYQSGGAGVLQGLALFDAERRHIEAAFAFLAAHPHRHDEVLLRLVDGVVYTGALRLHPRERICWLEAQRAAARRLGVKGAEGNALGNLGNAYFDLGETRLAIDHHEQSLVIARAMGDRRSEGAALGNLGLAYAALGEPRRAIDHHEQALAISREIGDRRGEGATLGNLGNAYFALGEPRLAIDFYEQQLVIAREIVDRRGEGNALGNLGNAYAALGELRRAIDHYEQHQVIARAIGDRRGEGATLGNLGNAYANLGEPRRAIDFFEQHLVIAREIGDRQGEGKALWNSALAYDKLGERAEAIARAAQALAIF